MDKNFTELIRKWLDTPAPERDYDVGALYLLKLSGNRIMYRNLIANAEGKAEFIEYQLRKYFKFRLAELTHGQVEEMQSQVDKIVESHLSLSEHNPAKDFKKGKRGDHDKLPDEIKACYVENLSIVQRMREVHLKLRSLSLEDSVCADSERYPFLKELIQLDKRLHENWETYDRFVQPENPSEFPKPKKSRKKIG